MIYTPDIETNPWHCDGTHRRGIERTSPLFFIHTRRKSDQNQSNACCRYDLFIYIYTYIYEFVEIGEREVDNQCLVFH